MKNLSKSLAIGLSLLTVGAMAQKAATLSKGGFTHPTVATGKYITSPKHPSTHSASVNIQSCLSDPLNGDEVLSGNTIYNWSPFMYLNAAYDNTDTIASTTVNVVTTVVDTLWDLYSQGYQTFVPGTAVVDTITCLLHYFNSSGNNDTIFIWVKSVTALGYPGNTVYGMDTIVVTPGTTFFPYNVLDSVQQVQVIKPISIPIGARRGWNFSVAMTVHCDKTMDTIGTLYYSQGTNVCSALGGFYCDQPTVVGVADSAVPHVNTFMTGLWAYNSPGNHGTGVSLSWPNLTSPFQGYYINSGGYYYAPLPLTLISAPCTDTAQFVMQDVAIFPSITGDVNTGVNNVAASGLSVGQNYPNPFNRTTTINYSLTKTSDVTFTVYDMTGRIIANNNYGSSAPGQHTINLSANTFSPGIYFYTFNVNGSTVTKKMVITE